FDKDTVTSKEMVQLAQEEFLGSWTRLGQWLEEDRQFLLWLSNLKKALQTWKAATSSRSKETTFTNPNSLLLQGDDLVTAQKWLKERYADIYPEERSFIELS